MRCRAGTHAGITARAIIEIDQEKILRFEQTLIEKIIEMQSARNGLLLVGCQPSGRHRLELLTHAGKFLQH